YDKTAIRAERCAVHLNLISFQDSNFRATLGLPHPSGAVLRRSHDAATVRAERRTPHPRGVVPGRSHDAAAVRAERRYLHAILMAVQDSDLCPALRSPHSRGTVVSPRHDAAAVRAPRHAVTALQDGDLRVALPVLHPRRT